MALNVASVPILFLVGAGSALFWTLGKLLKNCNETVSNFLSSFIGASCFVISLHAIFYNIDAIVTEESEGFLSEVV